jgi:hypothetical protein
MIRVHVDSAQVIRRAGTIAALVLTLLFCPEISSAQDVLSVASATATTDVIELPVYVRDVSATPLGVDQAAGSKAQGVAFRVNITPANAVKAIYYARGGVTSALTPLYELSLKPAGAVTYLGSFSETTSPIAFTSDAVAPGNQIGRLLVNLNAPDAGTVITIAFDSATATLSNQAGTVAETVSNGQLALGNGSITIPSFTAKSISPRSGPDSGGTGVTIAGAGFDAGATVTIGGTALGGPAVAATSITGTSPQKLPGTLHDVVVTNPGNVTRTLVNGWFSDFLDVPAASGLHTFVESILRAGLTGGCGGGNYCPSSGVTRQQMAVFLLRAKEGPLYFPPDATGTAFSDVPSSSPYARWIEELARRGVTGGCGGGNFCPGGSVSRAQMAVFLLVTFEGPGYSPQAATGMFNDVPTSSPYAKFIEELARRSITGGCGGGNYCPASNNTRGQMAVFLRQTFSLP